MDWSVLLLMAVALSMDAFAVSVANGLVLTKAGVCPSLRMAGSFGLFQAGMPLIGYAAALTFADTIRAIDHWVAFVLLVFVGGKMLWEVFFGKEEEPTDPTDLRNLLLLSVATSIDALAIGVSIAMMPKTGVLALPAGAVLAAAIIGVITFVICLFGVFLGRKAGSLLGRRAEIVGGLVLIGLGVKVLLEHTVLATG